MKTGMCNGVKVRTESCRSREVQRRTPRWGVVGVERGTVEEKQETGSFCGMTSRMEFKLSYDGILRSTTDYVRANIKHAIRKEIHKQLKTLWSIQPWLLELATHRISA
jgi:hypothetical protein